MSPWKANAKYLQVPCPPSRLTQLPSSGPELGELVTSAYDGVGGYEAGTGAGAGGGTAGDCCPGSAGLGMFRKKRSNVKPSSHHIRELGGGTWVPRCEDSDVSEFCRSTMVVGASTEAHGERVGAVTAWPSEWS